MIRTSPSPQHASGSLMLLAPASDAVPSTFQDVDVDPRQHEHLLSQVQRLRGHVYCEDGAITPAQLTADGRHVQEADQFSWHVVSVQPDGEVTGCARYRPHAPKVAPEELGVWRSALARDPAWRSSFRQAVVHEIDLAWARGLSYVEVGGWAVARQWRGSLHAFETALSTYALASGLGGCIGITTATVRHCSARILRKLGGRSLELAGLPLPSYFDPQYGCEMELLRFDSSEPNGRYTAHINHMAARLLNVPVVTARASTSRGSATHRRPPMLPTMAALAARHVPCFLGQEVRAPEGAHA
jgi:hypothetical protein